MLSQQGELPAPQGSDELPPEVEVESVDAGLDELEVVSLRELPVVSLKELEELALEELAEVDWLVLLLGWVDEPIVLVADPDEEVVSSGATHAARAPRRRNWGFAREEHTV